MPEKIGDVPSPQEQQPTPDRRAEIETIALQIQTKLSAALQAAERLEDIDYRNTLFIGIRNTLNHCLRELEGCAEVTNEIIHNL